MAVWLGLTYFVIALMAGGLVLYCLPMIGWRPPWRE